MAFEALTNLQFFEEVHEIPAFQLSDLTQDQLRDFADQLTESIRRQAFASDQLKLFRVRRNIRAVLDQAA